MRHSKGWYNGTLYDPPILGSAEMLKKFMDDGYEVVIFTARADDRTINGKFEPGEYDQVVAYLTSHRIPFSRVHRGVGKPFAKLYIDDNALRFTGDWDKAYVEAMDILTKRKED